MLRSLVGSEMCIRDSMKTIIFMTAAMATLLLVSLFSALKVAAQTPENTPESEVVKEKIVQIDACTYRLTLATSASKKSVWKLWEDVENWKDYDTILEYSYLLDNAKFEVGALGYVKADGAPKTKFEIIAVDRGNSCLLYTSPSPRDS